MSQELRLPGIEVVSAQVPGAKRAPGEQGDDRVRIGSSGSAVLIALADGAGGASRGGYGAELAAISAFESLSEQLKQEPDDTAGDGARACHGRRPHDVVDGGEGAAR